MATNVYQNVVLSVSSSNPQAGDRITVTLSKRGGKDIAWSTGQNFSTSSGISLNSTSGSVPVSRFSITNSVVTFILAPSDSANQVQFNAAAFLVAVPGIEEFTLTLTTDQGSAVSVVLPGRNPVPLSESPTVFDWTAQ